MKTPVEFTRHTVDGKIAVHRLYAVHTLDVELAKEFEKGVNLLIDVVNGVVSVVLLSFRLEEEDSQPHVAAEDPHVDLIVEGVPMSSTLLDVIALG